MAASLCLCIRLESVIVLQVLVHVLRRESLPALASSSVRAAPIDAPRSIPTAPEKQVVAGRPRPPPVPVRRFASTGRRIDSV
jgi:hypothetical protein